MKGNNPRMHHPMLCDEDENLPITSSEEHIKERTILIAGAITDDTISTIVVPLLRMDKEESEEPIKILIDSDGGSYHATMLICDVIDRLTSPTEIYVMSKAFSGGFFVACAGANNKNVKKFCYPHARFLCHEPRYSVGGTHSVITAMAGDTADIVHAIEKYLLTHTSIPENLYRAMQTSEWYMGAQEALGYGIVDEIL